MNSPKATHSARLRALSRPRIPFLDEGTAHLDVERETQINHALRRLDMTRVSVAHRPGMTEGADEIIEIRSPAT